MTNDTPIRASLKLLVEQGQQALREASDVLRQTETGQVDADERVLNVAFCLGYIADALESQGG